jgi:acetyl-CoA C-acetyltransferase
MKEVVIVAAVRTPMGSFGGVLSAVAAPKLGAAAIRGALNKINLNPELVQEVIMGNVLQANIGQAPARQAAIAAGLSKNIPCTTLNKVCASGMKAVIMAAQSIKAGDNDIVVAGGMENMSMVPYYMDKARNGYRLGDGVVVDGLVKDGLTDVYNKVHMGVCAEICADEMNFSREAQDQFALTSYERSAQAWKSGKFSEEIVPVEVPQRRGDTIFVTEDEEYTKINKEKFLMSATKALEMGITPLAKITSYADAAHEPEWFTTAPAKAIPLALSKAGLTSNDISYWELNEAFSVVGLANIAKLKLDAAKVNINGGAVSLGHPLGSSGARILVTLVNVLKQNSAKYGAAGICNGGGGASAMVLENL